MPAAASAASAAAGGGGGGGGSDMLARQSIDGRPRIVAVKILRQELLVDPEQVQLFLKEVSLLRKLRHRCGRSGACRWRCGAGGRGGRCGGVVWWLAGTGGMGR